MKHKYFPEGMKCRNDSGTGNTLSSDALEKAMRDGEILEGRAVLCDSRRDLIVELGAMKGIIPRGECVYNRDNSEVKDIAILTRVGKTVCFKVTDFFSDDNGERTALLSRRAAQKECCKEYIDRLCAGDIVEARVAHLERFGAFVDIGCGIVSLLSIDCMSVSRISHPRDRFEQGQCIRVIIKQPADKSGRLVLSHKELLGTWEENIKEYAVGMTAAGIVRSIESYGVFIELAPNLAGLAEFRQGVEVGNNVAVYIKSIIPEKMKLRLVLMDSGVPENHIIPCKYFYTGDHISEWKYSPDCCARVIKTVF